MQNILFTNTEIERIIETKSKSASITTAGIHCIVIGGQRVTGGILRFEEDHVA